jgi:ferredoxin
MSIAVNKNTCIGCGACASICPDSFAMGTDGKSDVISQENAECATNAAQSCPVQAITVE